jgi:hypothetical protein
VNGQVMQRREDEVAYDRGTPMELHYRFGGIAVADVGNNGTSNVSYAQSIAAHRAVPPGTVGPFRDGSMMAQYVGDLDQSYDRLNGLTYESTPSHYTVQGGDTLQSIAYALWGDSSFWYLIADANGLTGNETLAAGTDLIIPNKVHNAHNTSDVYRVYDPNEAIGNTSPTSPKPQKKGSNNCGIMGQILLVVVAVAVAALTAGAAVAALAPAGSALSTLGGAMGALASGSTSALAAAGITTGHLIGIGAVAGAVGSIASQGVGMAIGMQSRLDWGAVAMAGISGAVGAGLGTVGGLPGIGGAMVRGALGNAITQGIGVATGLQSKFDWAGVAAAGVMAGVSTAVGIQIGVGADGNTAFENHLLSGVAGMAGVIAGAATRTVMTGSDFGDNIMAMLPDAIGQTIGNMVAGAIQGSASDGPPKGAQKTKYGSSLDSNSDSSPIVLAWDPDPRFTNTPTQTQPTRTDLDPLKMLLGLLKIPTAVFAGLEVFFLNDGKMKPDVVQIDGSGWFLTRPGDSPASPWKVVEFDPNTGSFIEHPFEGVSDTYTADSNLIAIYDKQGRETGSVVFLSGERTDEGIQKGFGVETRNQDERDILGNGLAQRWSSDEINAAILAYRHRTTGFAGGGSNVRPPTFKLGESDGGPGKWAPAPPFVNLTEKQAAYQQHATGAPRGVEYRVETSAMKGGVKFFDGYATDTGNLIDAKRYEGWPRMDQAWGRASATADLRSLNAVGLDLNRTVEVSGRAIAWKKRICIRLLWASSGGGGP